MLKNAIREEKESELSCYQLLSAANSSAAAATADAATADAATAANFLKSDEDIFQDMRSSLIFTLYQLLFIC